MLSILACHCIFAFLGILDIFYILDILGILARHCILVAYPIVQTPNAFVLFATAQTNTPVDRPGYVFTISSGEWVEPDELVRHLPSRILVNLTLCLGSGNLGIALDHPSLLMMLQGCGGIGFQNRIPAGGAQ